MWKRFAKSALAAGAASFLIGAYLRLVFLTSKKTMIGREHYDNAAGLGNGVIMAFWHGRLMMTPLLIREADIKAHMLISTHRDGEIIANAVSGYGVNFIRGSAANPKKPGQSKGGAGAVAQIIAALEAGDAVGVTPDGPRGPAETVQPGILKIAQRTGAAIVPVGASASRAKQFTSWDRFLLALPFAKMVFAGEPAITVPGDASKDDLERLRHALKTAISEATARADAAAGRKKRNEG
ncbi:MAG: lysophospholipid acyltransferase family protein [Pseudomonadota bacterium]